MPLIWEQAAEIVRPPKQVCELCGQPASPYLEPLGEFALHPPQDGYQLVIVIAHRSCVHALVANRYR